MKALNSVAKSRQYLSGISARLGHDVIETHVGEEHLLRLRELHVRVAELGDAREHAKVDARREGVARRLGILDANANLGVALVAEEHRRVGRVLRDVDKLWVQVVERAVGGLVAAHDGSDVDGSSIVAICKVARAH